MQISDSMRGIPAVQTAGKAAELQQDQIATASIKQKISSNEAVVEINGQEYRATFEKGVPLEARTAVQITGRNGDVLQLRTVSTGGGKAGEAPSPEAVAERVLRDAGMKVTAEMKEAVRQLVAEHAPITKETLQSVQQIMQKGEGTVQQKIDVLSVMAQKKISVTPKSYDAVFRTLHGPSLDKILNDLAKEAPDLLPQPRGEVKASAQTVSSAGRKQTFSSTEDLARQLATLAKALSSERPINREALQKLAEQMKQNAESKNLSLETQRRVEQVIRQIEKVVQETPRTERVVPLEKIAQIVDKKTIELAARQVAMEIKVAGQEASKQEQSELVPTRNRSEAIQPAGKENPQAKRLVKQLDVLNQIIESEKPINKEQLQKLIQQLKQNTELAKMGQDTQRGIEQVIRQVEKAVQGTPRTEQMVSPERISRNVDKPTLEQLARKAAQEVKAADTPAPPPKLVAGQEAAVIRDTSSAGRAERSSNTNQNQNTRISQQLDVLQQAIKSERPINKEQLQKLVEQIKLNPEFKNISQETQQKLQQVLDQVTKAIQETPASQPTVSAEKLAQTVQRTVLEQTVHFVAKEAEVRQKVEISQPSEPQTAPVQKNMTVTDVVSSKPISEPMQKLAELVLDIRMSGKVTRSQMAALQELVSKVTEEAKLTPALAKDIQDLTNRIAKDLRMSLSYEAVGKNVEAKVMVERSMDTLVKLFKLPIAEVLAAKNDRLVLEGVPDVEGTEQAGPQFLRPVSETFMRLGSMAGLARQELLSALSQGQTTGSIDDLFAVPRQPEQIVRDVASSLRSAAVREALPREETRRMEQILQRLEEEVNRPQHDTKSLLDGMDELEQLLTGSGERMAALTAVQTSNFERITQYIPDHLREVGNEFKQMKKEIINNIERMSQFLQQKVPQAASYVQRIVEPTIEMVNRLVTKGEFALFADMEFEHDVLRISGDLQQVKGLLDKGKQDEALQIFQRVRADLEKLNWQPSYMKVERFFSKMTGEGEMQNPFQTYGQQWREESLTGRGVQDVMKGMGLNHEREALEWLGRREGHPTHFSGSHTGTGSDGRGNQENPPHNLKSMLMDGMESAVSPRAKEMMEQALSNVTGQQLLSKQDPGAPMQSLHVQLPLPWEEGMQSAQLQVHSRVSGEQMDWENCSLFFFLDTPKFGETGVAVTVVDREMTVRVQNDNVTIEQAFAPYIPQLKKEMQGMGYRVNGVTFAPASQPVETKEQESLPTVDVATAKRNAARYISQEGLDFSV